MKITLYKNSKYNGFNIYIKKFCVCMYIYAYIHPRANCIETSSVRKINIPTIDCITKQICLKNQMHH